MRVALIGGSGFGRYHLQAWRKHRDLTQITVIGRDPDRLAALEQEFEVAVTTDLGAVDGADLVDVCTPPDTHFELAWRAVAAGRPTIVEKPPCRYADQAEELAARAGAVPLLCVMNQRFAPHWRRARELVADGLIGPPRLSLWPVLADQRALMAGGDFRADAARGGGALLDGAFHLAYLVPWVLGEPIRAVSAWTARLAAREPAGEDTGLCCWETDRGAAQIAYSWAVVNPPRSPAATIIGEAGTLLVPRSARQPLELVRERETVELDLGEHRTMPRNDLGNCLTHYAAAALGHTEPEATWSEAVTAQRVIEASERSAAKGRRIALGA